MRLLGFVLIGLIRAYRLFLSPVLPMSCRYEPSCSHYACDAIARHGAIRGTWLAAARIVRCHPWGGAGYDPVPERVTLRPAWTVRRADCGGDRGLRRDGRC